MACSLTSCCLATSATGLGSASRRIATICSSVKRLFFIGSLSALQEPFSQLTIGPQILGRSTRSRATLRAFLYAFVQQMPRFVACRDFEGDGFQSPAPQPAAAAGPSRRLPQQ